MGLAPVLQARAGHALANAAVFDEVLLESFNLPVQQVVGLVDQANRNL
jgi:hypothetical protein